MNSHCRWLYCAPNNRVDSFSCAFCITVVLQLDTFEYNQFHLTANESNHSVGFIQYKQHTGKNNVFQIHFGFCTFVSQLSGWDRPRLISHDASLFWSATKLSKASQFSSLLLIHLCSCWNRAEWMILSCYYSGSSLERLKWPQIDSNDLEQPLMDSRVLPVVIDNQHKSCIT